MTKHTVAGAMLFGGILSAQNIVGDWQGKLKLGTAEIRVVINIANAATGGWTATESTPDEGSNGIVATTVTFDGSTLKIAFDQIRARYEGILTEDKVAFKGTLTQGPPLPLDLE